MKTLIVLLMMFGSFAHAAPVQDADLACDQAVLQIRQYGHLEIYVGDKTVWPAESFVLNQQECPLQNQVGVLVNILLGGQSCSLLVCVIDGNAGLTLGEWAQDIESRQSHQP